MGKITWEKQKKIIKEGLAHFEIIVSQITMNPEAPEYKPPSLKNNAWSNPAKSVHIAKLPQRRQNVKVEDQIQAISTTSQNQKDLRVLPQPNKLKNDSKESDEDDQSWQTIGKKGKTLEETENMSEADLEIKRKQRRERRQRAKEVKKIKKEEERRKKDEEKLNTLRAAKDTKIKLIDAGIINKFKANNSQAKVNKSVKGTEQER